ncbi:hypothetical protein [Streptomyces fagopyri]|uniref:hypothetical protein n=1 Tax=Streptomyces fagopyri TaxID=2662397 RepID=UPI0037FED3FB
MLVSCDDGAPVTVKTYTAEVPSRTETPTLQVPAGARTARFRCRRTGGYDWYRVIGGVRIEQA